MFVSEKKYFSKISAKNLTFQKQSLVFAAIEKQ